MVTRYGMSEMGLVALENSGNEIFLGRSLMPRSEYSEEVATQIDRHVREIALHCYQEARRIIRDHRPLVDRLVEVLLDKETIDGDEFRQIVEEYTEQQAVAVVQS